MDVPCKLVIPDFDALPWARVRVDGEHFRTYSARVGPLVLEVSATIHDASEPSEDAAVWSVWVDARTPFQERTISMGEGESPLLAAKQHAYAVAVAALGALLNGLGVVFDAPFADHALSSLPTPSLSRPCERAPESP